MDSQTAPDQNQIATLKLQLDEAMNKEDFKSAAELTTKINALTVNQQFIDLCMESPRLQYYSHTTYNRIRAMDGFNMNATNSDGVPAVFLAASNNFNLVFDLMNNCHISRESIAYKDSDGNTLLHKYLSNPIDNRAQVETVIEASELDLLAENNHGQSAVAICKEKNPKMLSTVMDCLERQVKASAKAEAKKTAANKAEREMRIVSEPQDRSRQEESKQRGEPQVPEQHKDIAYHMVRFQSKLMACEQALVHAQQLLQTTRAERDVLLALVGVFINTPPSN